MQREYNLRDDVRRKVVSGPRIGDLGLCPHALATEHGELERHRKGARCHFRIVDAAPEVAAIGHVTGLAGLPGAAGETVAPLRIRILEELSIQAGARLRKLMTDGAETAVLESGVGAKPAVRQAVDGRRPCGWAEATMSAYMAGGTNKSLAV